MGVGEKIDLLLHMGFPKAISSTLQFGLFKNMQVNNLVKLLTWRQYDSKESHDFRPSSCLFKGKPILDNYLNFTTGILNILSDESFTAPIRLRRNNFGDNLCHPFTFPKRIKDQIDERFGRVNYHCLVVLRRHADLIFSQYVEEYNLLKYKGVNLLFYDNSEINMDGYDIYFYCAYINILHEVFGAKNVTILFYEDLIKGNHEFFEGLSNCLPISDMEIKSILESSKFNIKDKNSRGYLTKDGILIDFLSKEQNYFIKKYFLKDSLKLQEIEGIGQKLVEHDYI